MQEQISRDVCLGFTMCEYTVTRYTDNSIFAEGDEDCDIAIAFDYSIPNYVVLNIATEPQNDCLTACIIEMIVDIIDELDHREVVSVLVPKKTLSYKNIFNYKYRTIEFENNMLEVWIE